MSVKEIVPVREGDGTFQCTRPPETSRIFKRKRWIALSGSVLNIREVRQRYIAMEYSHGNTASIQRMAREPTHADMASVQQMAREPSHSERIVSDSGVPPATDPCAHKQQSL